MLDLDRTFETISNLTCFTMLGDEIFILSYELLTFSSFPFFFGLFLAMNPELLYSEGKIYLCIILKIWIGLTQP